MLKRLNAPEFKEKLDFLKFILLDTRTAQEQMIFWVISESQEHIDVYKQEALDAIKKLPKEGKYLIYCYHGNRSRQVGDIMTQLGFDEVYDLIWWIEEWKKLMHS